MVEKQEKVWSWYKDHDNVVNTFVDIACDLVPAGNIVRNMFNLGISKLEDDEEREKKEYIVSLLDDVYSKLYILIEKVEAHDEYHKKISSENIKEIIDNDSYIKDKFDDEVIPKIHQSITQSIEQYKSKPNTVLALIHLPWLHNPLE